MMRERIFGDAGKSVLIEELLPAKKPVFTYFATETRAVPLAQLKITNAF